MTSKVLVKLPTVPFSQGKKSTPELMSLPARNDGVATPLRTQQAPGNGDRTAQLEQNMKFLQEQHQATLVALHQEVETLRQRNRDLQFQLVFTKGTGCSNSPSSPEDNSSGFVKPKGSPVSVNVTPLQIELLERDLEELRVSFNDVKNQNVHLLEIIEQQKLKLEQTAKEKEKDKLKVTDAAIQVEETNSVNSELVARLEDAELLVKKLQRENSEQQREISTIKASSAKNTGGNRSGHGRGRGNNENGHHSRGSSGDPGQSSRNSYNFPPLESESYWRNVARGRPSYDRQSGHHRRNRMEKKDSEPDISRHIVLPELLNSNVKPEIPCYPQFYPRSSRGYHNGGGGSAGGNYYRDGGNRKFRGQGRQKDRRDQQDSRGDHRDYRDRNSRDQSRDFNDGAHMSKKQ